MKTHLLAAAAAGLLSTAANGAFVAWQAPVLISGASDVNTQGNYFGSWAPYNGGASSTPVNGVSFQGFSDLPSLSGGFDDGGGYWNNHNTPDANYNTLLSYGGYLFSSNNMTFSWGGMIPGNTYLVELWIADPRSIGNSRAATVFSGDGDLSGVMNYPADGSSHGSYLIGTFVAGASGSQSLTIDPSQNGDPNSGSAQLNLFQVRDLGVVPEPASVGLFGAGLLGFLMRRRRD
ncbi:MAG: hypothetical protein JWO82_3793 [Akkermansiaceae bacterium]|nr:hypothetical protein [Akkermansiaceae bacterium]